MQVDRTANSRQKRRLDRLYQTGVGRTTVLIHEENRATFDVLRPLLRNPKSSKLLKQAARLVAEEGPINVSQVAQLSPFRYPGGKTWLVPEIRNWIRRVGFRPDVFVEPFAGGGIAGLTVAAEDLADKVVMSELDEDVASVWKTILKEPEWLCSRIMRFEVTHENVLQLIDKSPQSIQERAFQTIIRNRTQRGGILAPGAGLVKNGENGKGITSRWYPETLVKRIRRIHAMRRRISFVNENGMDVISTFAKDRRAAFFIDPPYTAGGKKAGKRLYRHSDIDHDLLFRLMKKVKGSYMMTYDDSTEVREMATSNSMKIDEIAMKNTHHAVVRELVITKPE